MWLSSDLGTVTSAMFDSVKSPEIHFEKTIFLFLFWHSADGFSALGEYIYLIKTQK